MHAVKYRHKKLLLTIKICVVEARAIREQGTSLMNSGEILKGRLKEPKKNKTWNSRMGTW